MESAKSEAARVQPDTGAQAARADAERNMIKAVSALTNLPAEVQAEANAWEARQALYDYMKADESNKAAAHSKAAEQLKKSISSALETKGLDAATRQALEEMLDNIDSVKSMRDNGGQEKGTEIKTQYTKPYSNSRPKYGPTQVEDVWNTYVDSETGMVKDPSGASITWDRTKLRNGQWDMGHKPGQEYSDTHARYMSGEISLEEFLKWFRNPENYRPELPKTNRGHLYEKREK